MGLRPFLVYPPLPAFFQIPYWLSCQRAPSGSPTAPPSSGWRPAAPPSGPPPSGRPRPSGPPPLSFAPGSAPSGPAPQAAAHTAPVFPLRSYSLSPHFPQLKSNRLREGGCFLIVQPFLRLYSSLMRGFPSSSASIVRPPASKAYTNKYCIPVSVSTITRAIPPPFADSLSIVTNLDSFFSPNMVRSPFSGLLLFAPILLTDQGLPVFV